MLLGNTILIKLNGETIAAQKGGKISTECETIDTASPNSGAWKTRLAGRKDWSLSCSWLVVTSSALKTHALCVGTVYTITITDGTTTMTGSAICKRCEADLNMASLVKGSFVFEGNGELQ